jgi:hypothetical protein
MALLPQAFVSPATAGIEGGHFHPAHYQKHRRRASGALRGSFQRILKASIEASDEL